MGFLPITYSVLCYTHRGSIPTRCAPFLPLELWIMVAEHLKPRDLLAMSATCRAWYRVAHAMTRFLPSDKRLVGVRTNNIDKLLGWLGNGTLGTWDFYTQLVAHPSSRCYDPLSQKYLMELFGKVHTLKLSGSVSLVDVSALGGVHTLYLSYCSNVVDVSALGNVHNLNLSDCRSVVDVRALGNVHTLNLSYCENVVDVSALGSVHTLKLSGCVNVVDVSALGNVNIIR